VPCCLLFCSLYDLKDFASADRLAADNMVEAADITGLKRIIYLGGLGETSDLSKAPALRAEVAAILQAGPVPRLFYEQE
jgi:hypothetical protein